VEALEVPFQLIIVATRRILPDPVNPAFITTPYYLHVTITVLAPLVAVTLVTVDWGIAGEGELTDPFDPSVPEPRNADATLTLQPSPQAQAARNDCYCRLERRK
jgi:hypothetical protein